MRKTIKGGVKCIIRMIIGIVVRVYVVLKDVVAIVEMIPQIMVVPVTWIRILN
jgi:hypothetical protein